MAARNFLPTFRRILHRASVYVAKHDTFLNAAMTPTQQTAYTSFKNALLALVTALGPEPISN